MRHFLCLTALCAATGCHDDGRVRVYPVTGTVTVNGDPAEGAFIYFHPTSDDPNALKPTATTDAQGNLIVTTYETGDGAPAGEYRLGLEWPIPVNAMGRLQKGPDRLAGKFADPGRSDLTITVDAKPTALPPIALSAQIKEVKPSKVRPER